MQPVNYHRQLKRLRGSQCSWPQPVTSGLLVQVPYFFFFFQLLSAMCSYLPVESHVPLHPVWVILLDLWVKHLDDIIHHLASDLVQPTAWASAPCELVRLLKDLKRSKPAWRYRR